LGEVLNVFSLYSDIKNMCVTAAQILANDRVVGNNGSVGAVVQSPFGIPACVTLSEFGSAPNLTPTSCFPIRAATRARLGALCGPGAPRTTRAA